MGMAAAWVVSLGIVFLRRNLKWGQDSQFQNKPQRLHQHEVSRLGGIGIILGLAAYAIFSVGPISGNMQPEPFPVWVVLVGLPVFGLGLIEDFTGAIAPRFRLGAAMLSAWAASFFLDSFLMLGDSGLAIQVVMVLFTGLCVGGVVNAFNIIDGLNGLASGVAILSLSLLGFVANQVGDALLVQLAVGTVCATLGFLLVNYPHGRLFLGDGGAYLLGFLVAEMSVLLVVRHPSISWFFPLACVIYPVTETLFSIYRRKMKRADAQKPDALHLHTLVHKRLNHWGNGVPSRAALANSLSTTFFWSWQVLSGLIILMIWDRTLLLIGYCVVQVGVYLGLYHMLTRFKSPRWMRLIARPDTAQTEFNWGSWQPRERAPVLSQIQSDKKNTRSEKRINPPEDQVQQTQLWS